MLFVKFAVLETPDTVELQKYLALVLAELQYECAFEADDEYVKVFFETQRDVKEFLCRVLEDYATLGYETGTEVELFDLNVFTDDPEMQAFFMNHRMNIQQCSTEALSEIIVETSNEAADLRDQIDKMDAQLTMNGLYKFRQILKVISDRLDEKGIFIAEDVNRLSAETVH